MSNQGLETIDHTVHQTHEWINELSARLEWSSKRSALHLMRAVLHLVRDRLLVDELAQFSAQLPLLVRGMLYEGWVPKITPIKDRSPETIAANIDDAMGGDPEYRGTEDIRCVFDLLNNHISRGEIEDVRAQMPESLRILWAAP